MPSPKLFTHAARSLLLSMAVCLASPSWAQNVNAGLEKVRQGDYTEALKVWQPLADQGDATAQNNLGTLYEHGHGVKQDYAAALKWYSKAAQQGNVHAQLSLGAMYYNGHGVKQDHEQALAWLRKAAAQGNADTKQAVATLENANHQKP